MTVGRRLLTLCLVILTLFSMVHVIADSSSQREDLTPFESSSGNGKSEEVSLNSGIPPEMTLYPDVLTDEEKENIYIARKHDEELTLYDLVFENEDHSRTAYFYSYPVKYTTEEGAIRDKSTALFQVNPDNSVIALSQTSTLSSEQAAISLQELSSKGEPFSKVAYASLDNDVRTYYSQDIEDGIIVSKGSWLFKMTPLIFGTSDATRHIAAAETDDSSKSIEYHQQNQENLVIRYVPTQTELKKKSYCCLHQIKQSTHFGLLAPTVRFGKTGRLFI